MEGGAHYLQGESCETTHLLIHYKTKTAQGSILSSCLGWQVTLAFKKKSKTKHRKKLRSPPPKTKESNNKKNPSPKPRNLHHNPEKKSHILAEISNREIILQNIGRIYKSLPFIR